MKCCPLISYAKQYATEIECMGEECNFTDEAGECLIKQALQCYVAKERTQAAIEQTALHNLEASYTPNVIEYAPALIEYYKRKSDDPENWAGLQGGV